MNPVVRRIAIHAAVSAVVLGVVGLLLVQVASLWLASPGQDLRPGEKLVAAEGDDAFLVALRWRVPLFVACGVAFVAAWGVAAHYLAKRKAASAPQPDPAEKLLEQLLTQAESVRGTPQEPTSDDRQQAAAQPEESHAAK